MDLIETVELFLDQIGHSMFYILVQNVVLTGVQHHILVPAAEHHQGLHVRESTAQCRISHTPTCQRSWRSQPMCQPSPWRIGQASEGGGEGVSILDGFGGCPFSLVSLIRLAHS